MSYIEVPFVLGVLRYSETKLGFRGKFASSSTSFVHLYRHIYSPPPIPPQLKNLAVYYSASLTSGAVALHSGMERSGKSPLGHGKGSFFVTKVCWGLSPRPEEKYESMRQEEIVVKNIMTSMLQRSVYTVSWNKMEKSNCYGTEPALPLWLVSTLSRLGDREVGRKERQKKKDKAPISVRQFCLCRGKSQRQVCAILRSAEGSLAVDQLPSRERISRKG